MDKGKRDEINQWIIKAQHDLGAARLLIQSNEPYLDIVVYHCQQAGEKALKAYLTYQDVIFPKTHSLNILLDLCEPFNQEFEQWQEVGEILTPYAATYRYPGDSLLPDQAEAEVALKLATDLINFVISALPDEFNQLFS
jgi:HEPN domain-containing protein